MGPLLELAAVHRVGTVSSGDEVVLRAAHMAASKVVLAEQVFPKVMGMTEAESYHTAVGELGAATWSPYRVWWSKQNCCRK